MGSCVNWILEGNKTRKKIIIYLLGTYQYIVEPLHRKYAIMFMHESSMGCERLNLSDSMHVQNKIMQCRSTYMLGAT